MVAGRAGGLVAAERVATGRAAIGKAAIVRAVAIKRLLLKILMLCGGMLLLLGWWDGIDINPVAFFWL